MSGHNKFGPELSALCVAIAVFVVEVIVFAIVVATR